MMQNLANAFFALAYRWPDRVAVDAPEQRLTYKELIDKAVLLADILDKKGVEPGDRIAIALTRNDEALLAMLGVWILGATALILDFRARAAERNHIAENIGVKFFIEDRPASGNETYPALKLPASWDSESLSGLKTYRKPSAADNAVALIAVSSGTSGTPKPVAISHECLIARYAIARTSPQWRPGGRFIVTAPLAFSATRKHVLSRLLDGGTVIFMPPLVSPRDIVTRVTETGADSMLTVPVIARQLMELAPESGALFENMEWLMCCGAPMTPQEKVDVRDKLCRGFVQNYGSTMAGMITLLETCDIEVHADSVGRPLPHVLVEIVDDEHQAVSSGKNGQIRVRTPGAGAELDGVSGNSRRLSDLIIDGWIYPGDIGKLDEEGFLHIVGRSSDLIIRAGVNVYPDEVESVLSSHQAVAEAAVVGWPDKMVGEEIVAFVVIKESVKPQSLLAWCRVRLQSDKQPRQLFIIEAMPRNVNGKLLRKELIALLPEC